MLGGGARLIRLASVGVVVAGCGSTSTVGGDGDPVPYLDDASYRRAELLASLVNPDNGYSRVREAHYATGDPNDWDRLPEWNPASEPIAATELDGPGGASTTSLSPGAGSLALPGSVAGPDDPALVALGKAAFARYPAQLAPYLGVALASREAAARYGLWVDEQRGVGGLVRARMADGSAAIALTCSTCHATPGEGGIADGLTNPSLNLGAAILDAAGGLSVGPVGAAIAAWGPARLDVTTPLGTEPARIPDLRPARFLTHLHQDATVVARDRTALAIRIETLITMSYGQVLRPPRIVALAIAAYLSSLADALPPMSAAEAASPRGAAVFGSACASCHVPPALTGPPVALEVVGTDPTLGRSAERGTGAYRVPSLRGVGSRTPLLHDGTLPSLEAMFDPARTSATFGARLHGAGPVAGHTFGLDLPDADRQALLAFVRAL